METYPRAAVERAMKVQEVIMRAMAKKITWTQAGEILGLCDRQMRRWKERYIEFGYDGLFDHRLGKPSPKRVPMATVEEILRLYQEQYVDFNVRHFHESQPGQCESSADSNCHAHHRHLCALLQDHLQHVSTLGPKRQANSNFALALRHTVRNYAIDADDP